MGMYTAGYYPHNYDFLAFAAMMIGRGEEAIGAAETVTTLLPQELFGAAGMDFLQHFLPGTPLEKNGQDSFGILMSWSNNQSLSAGFDHPV